MAAFEHDRFGHRFGFGFLGGLGLVRVGKGGGGHGHEGSHEKGAQFHSGLISSAHGGVVSQETAPMA